MTQPSYCGWLGALRPWSGLGTGCSRGNALTFWAHAANDCVMLTAAPLLAGRELGAILLVQAPVAPGFPLAFLTRNATRGGVLAKSMW
jgi:hypothetical protein